MTANPQWPSLSLQSVSSCPACEAQSAQARFRSPDFLHGVPGDFQYVECLKCGSVYQNPRVIDDDLARCYPPDYFTKNPPSSRLQARHRPGYRQSLRESILLAADGGQAPSLSPVWVMIGRVLALSPALRQRARFGLIDGLGCPRGGRERCLEVGPGQGMDLRSLRALGWEAVGLDADSAAAATASLVSGCEVRVGSLATVEFPQHHFALIYMNHVLEHLPDLHGSLRRCFELLSDSGRLVLVYPNPRALTALRYGLHSCVWDPPRHLVLPSLGAIKGLLGRLGFVQVRVHTTPRRAPAFRQVSLRYRSSRVGVANTQPLASSLTVGDLSFGLAEAAMVRVGLPVGEEVVVHAAKQRSDQA